MDSLARLSPVSDAYATMPVAQAFDWVTAGADLPVGEWYLVAFRSTRRDGADEDRLHHYDDLAHHEAEGAPGFVVYFKGPVASDGTCLSFCMWDSRAHARAAAGGPAHLEAVSLIGEMYQRYELEFWRVQRAVAGAPLSFEPYDRVPSEAERQPPPLSFDLGHGALAT